MLIKDNDSTAQERPYTSVLRDTDSNIGGTSLSGDSNSLNDSSDQQVEESAESLEHNSGMLLLKFGLICC